MSAGLSIFDGKPHPQTVCFTGLHDAAGPCLSDNGQLVLLPWFIVVGILAEIILWKGITLNRLTVSWTVSSLLYNGVNLLPVWFFWDTYYSFAVASGMEQSYIDAYVQYYTAPGWVVFILILPCSAGFWAALSDGS